MPRIPTFVIETAVRFAFVLAALVASGSIILEALPLA